MTKGRGPGGRGSVRAVTLIAVISAALSYLLPGSGRGVDDSLSRTEPRSPGTEPRPPGTLNLPGLASTNFGVSIRKPSGPPRVATGLIDLQGNMVTAACSTCHATRQPNHRNKVAKDLDEFHGGMPFSHGSVRCLSCHNDHDYDALKLADGSRVEFTDVMTLCAQCHGPQMTAYKHGAHGGMTGYWDLNRGPQVKNNCIDCHDPHAPQFPKMQPTFKPRDRFLEVPHHDGAFREGEAPSREGEAPSREGEAPSEQNGRNGSAGASRSRTASAEEHRA